MSSRSMPLTKALENKTITRQSRCSKPTRSWTFTCCRPFYGFCQLVHVSQKIHSGGATARTRPRLGAAGDPHGPGQATGLGAGFMWNFGFATGPRLGSAASELCLQGATSEFLYNKTNP